MLAHPSFALRAPFRAEFIKGYMTLMEIIQAGHESWPFTSSNSSVTHPESLDANSTLAASRGSRMCVATLSSGQVRDDKDVLALAGDRCRQYNERP